MPEAVLVTADLLLRDKLKAIRRADGYHYDLFGNAVKLDPEHDVGELVPGAEPPIGPPRPFAVLDLSAPVAYSYERGGQITTTRPFTVVWIHDSDPTDDESRMRVYGRGIADVEMALAADDTVLLSAEMREPEGREVWALISGEVRNHRAYGAPNASS